MTDAIAMFAAGIAALALVVAAAAARYSYVQTRAALRQATAAEETVRLQADALRTQAEATATAMQLAERSASASETSAESAAASVEVAQESMRRSLRAYVTVETIQPHMQDNQKIPRAIELILVNTGQTPASRPVLFYHIGVFAAEPPEQQFDPAGPKYRSWPRADLGRDQRIRLYKEYYPKDDELTGIQQRGRFLMIYGALRYRDMFTNEERLTEFCYGYDTISQQFGPVGPMNRAT